MSYRVRLQVFEGPLDLLLYLIKKNEVDIYNIPIAEITRQYLDYLQMMEWLDLNVAGEFLVMAATLMHIKSRMLLPQTTQPLEEEELDPREELVRRLLEYQRYKEAATFLTEREAQELHVYTRPATWKDDPDAPAEEVGFEASLFDLLTALSKILKDIPKEQVLELIRDEFTVEEKLAWLRDRFRQEERLAFHDLFGAIQGKSEMIATFLALLELIRCREIWVRQEGRFGPIMIVRRHREPSAPAPSPA